MIPLLPAQEPSPAPEVFKDSVLEFRYTPPANIHDFTSLDRESIQERSTAPGTELTLLLSLRSGEDVAAVDWRSIKIVTYPSEQFGNLRDSTASQEAFSQTGHPACSSKSQK